MSYSRADKYRLVQKKGTVLLRTSLAWPAVAGCSPAETFSQLSAISFAQPCTHSIWNGCKIAGTFFSGDVSVLGPRQRV